MLGIFHALIVVCNLFSKLTFSKNSFRNTISVSNRLDPDQDRHSFSPDLGPNCLQRKQKTPLARKELSINNNPIIWAVMQENLSSGFPKK